MAREFSARGALGWLSQRPGRLAIMALLVAIVVAILPTAIRWLRMRNQFQCLVTVVSRFGGSAWINEGGFDLGRGQMDITVYVHGPGINDAMLGAIAAMPVFRDVRQLRLVNTRITDDGVKVLVGHPSLVALDLSGSAVTDRSFESLAAISGLNTLKLSGTSVSNVGLETLERLRKEGPPMMLDVTDTAVTKEGVGRLCAAFTQWNVVYGSSKNPNAIK